MTGLASYSRSLLHVLMVAFLLISLLPLCCCRLHIPIKRGREPVNRNQPHQAKEWFQKIGSSNFTYWNLVTMLSRKKNLLNNIGNHIQSIQHQSVISPEVHFKMKVLNIYQRELKAAENSLVTVLRDLNQTLSSDYRSIENIKQSCKMRQEDMKNAAILVEEDYNVILDLEKEMLSHHPNTSLQTHFKLVNNFLSEIAQAADKLENRLAEDVFSDFKNMEGAGIETVVKLSEGSLHEHNLKRLQDQSKKGSTHKASLHQEGGISMLIDSASNQYILSRPRDVTLSIEDHHLIHDIVNLLLLSFFFGAVCSIVKIPSLFGFIFAGMVLGPTGFNWIGSVVQVETLGEVGVIFIIFMVGLEFSPQKLNKVWNVAVYGGNLQLACSIILAILLGLIFQVHPRHSLFVAACLSFSSNPLATRIVNIPESDIVDSVSGVLMMQDVQLGTLMALLPFFEGRGSSKESPNQASTILWFMQLLQVAFGFPILVLIFRALATRIVGRFYRHFSHILNRSENILLGSIALCFGLLLAAEELSASLELGCFLAGVVISSQGPSEVDQVKKAVEPIRDFFSVFFFASLGFHVYPTFLRSEFSTMCGVMVCIVILKFIISMGVLGFFIGHCKKRTLIISLALAQVSEFSFVLSSRARRMGIISREVYLVILSITTLSLLLTPLLWRVFHIHRPPFTNHSIFSALSSTLRRKLSSSSSQGSA